VVGAQEHDQSAGGAYTFSKLIDVGQLGYRDPLVNRNLDRGLAPDNAPNRFTPLDTTIGCHSAKGPSGQPLDRWSISSAAGS
jgi:hypothetical protein